MKTIFIFFILLTSIYASSKQILETPLYYRWPVQDSKKLNHSDYLISPLTLTNEFQRDFKKKQEELYFKNSVHEQNYSQRKFKNLNEELSSDQKNYSLYMSRKIFEYHITEMMKEDQNLKPILVMNESLQDFNVNVSPSIRLNSHLSLGENSIFVKLENSFIDYNFSLRMSPKAFFLGSVSDIVTWMEKDIGSTKVTLKYSVFDKDFELVTKNQVTNTMTWYNKAIFEELKLNPNQYFQTGLDFSF